MTAIAGLLLLALSAQTPTVAVSFDPRALSEKDYRRLDVVSLDRKVAIRLIQEGFAVLAPGQPSVVIRVVLRRKGQGLTLEAHGPTTRLETGVRPDKGSTAELHLEIAQKVSELVHATPIPPPPPAEPAPPRPLAAPAPVIVNVASPSEPQRRTAGVSLSLTGGVSWRNTAPEPLVVLNARFGRSAVGVDADLGVSAGSNSDVGVIEPRLAVGVGYRFRPAEHTLLEPSAAVGALLHVYRLSDPWSSASQGALLLPAGWGRLRAQWFFAERFALEVRLAVGLSPSVTHTSEGVPLWQQGVLRGETSLGVCWSP